LTVWTPCVTIAQAIDAREREAMVSEPTSSSVMGELKSADERKAVLARTVSNQVAAGWRVQSQSDYQAVLVKGRHVRHILHLVLTILTVGAWAVIWLVMWLLYRERRQIANVDEYGNVNVSRV
jgi:hypothetical protein